MIRYIIIDDETIAHEIIKGYCDRLPNMKFMGSCFDALEALELLQNGDIDLIFLDLNMPKIKGFDFLKTLNTPPQVIVTTAYQEFALEGFELNVVDYLLKPFGFDRFLKAVNKLAQPVSGSTISALKSEPTNVSPSIFIKSENKQVQLFIDQILYLEAAGNYTKIITPKATHLTRDKISSLTQRLPEEQFLQVHKSYVVAKQHITSIEGNRVLMNKHSIPVGKVYKHNISRLFES
ncbi:MAG: LytTR family DNA-binding domain-containing protein [Bacteroidota bacterium]